MAKVVLEFKQNALFNKLGNCCASIAIVVDMTCVFFNLKWTHDISRQFFSKVLMTNCHNTRL